MKYYLCKLYEKVQMFVLNQFGFVYHLSLHCGCILALLHLGYNAILAALLWNAGAHEKKVSASVECIYMFFRGLASRGLLSFEIRYFTYQTYV